MFNGKILVFIINFNVCLEMIFGHKRFMIDEFFFKLAYQEYGSCTVT